MSNMRATYLLRGKTFISQNRPIDHPQVFRCDPVDFVIILILAAIINSTISVANRYRVMAQRATGSRLCRGQDTRRTEGTRAKTRPAGDRVKRRSVYIRHAKRKYIIAGPLLAGEGARLRNVSRGRDSSCNSTAT